MEAATAYAAGDCSVRTGLFPGTGSGVGSYLFRAYIVGMSMVQDSADRQAAEAAVRKQPMPSFVRGFDVEFGEDHDGDPAVWILFHLGPEEDAPLTPDRLAALEKQAPDMNALTSAVRSAVSNAVPGRLAYTRFVAGTASGS